MRPAASAEGKERARCLSRTSDIIISMEEEKPITRTNEVQQEDSGNSAEQMQEASVSAE